ncbi:LacI family DNA-binding transcriptional regulator [Catenulispora sp. NL8]|uniref:LacI family DNA-binding transcriptional regulator n=1 Tax=Catenulispora pinistramenti TaxID=2705254 RepID=A0ABS5L155_9ACTN|nr:LacI family DNA-binding transcriptional regulator [Catenulispora pinistramenti]MBS2551880.1 LacI family DNA-binding transcriptional regulator [Catenulispora pinistramenti]
MTDVARAAGVSQSTVSRVFSLPDTVRADTRDRVLEAARRLEFTPNPAASALAQGRTGTLGLLVPNVVNPYYAEIIKVVQHRARAKGHTLVLADTGDEPEDGFALARAVGRQTDGLLLAGPRMTDAMVGELARSGPVALIGAEAPGADSVYAEPATGMRQVIRHLAALGHSRIVYVDGTLTARDPACRQPVHDACAEFGVDLVEQLGPFDLTFDNGVAAADLVPTSGATAVIAHNEMVAHGVACGLARQGRSVPGDFSLVSVDDTFMARTIYPALTVLHVPLDLMGARGVDLLLHRIEDPDGAIRHSPLPTSLVVRESTGRPGSVSGDV